MKSHFFYAGLFVITLVGLALFVPSNYLTGLSVESCDGCGLLCENNNECSQGLECCQTNWDLGVCHHESACLSVAELSKESTLEEYKNPERPKAINNIAWQTFGVPLLVVMSTVIVAIYLTRKRQS